MNSIIKRLSCLVLIVCSFVIAGNVDYSKKVDNAKSIVDITTDYTVKKAAVIEDSKVSNGNLIPIGASNAEKEAFYNALHEEHAANFDGPTLWTEIEVAPNNGSREGTVSAVVNSQDSWPSEIYFILLDTQNYYSWGCDGWCYFINGAGESQEFSASVPAGNYIFILADSYGDGGADATVSVNGEVVGSIDSIDGTLSPYSGLYETALNLDVQDADGGGGDVTYSANFALDGISQCDWVSVTGTFDQWSGWGVPYGDGVTSIGGLADGSTHEFLILCAQGDGWWYDIWASSTILQPELGSECDYVAGDEYANYGFTVSGADVDVALCAGSCDATCDDGGSSCTDYSYSCGGGSWGSEVSWVLGDYSGGVGDGSVCLDDGDHTLTMNDSYGDGWNGNSWNLSDADGNLVASCSLASGSTGDCTFSTGGAPPVYGCMDPNSPNYNPDAEQDDGSCEAYIGMDCAYFGSSGLVDCNLQYCVPESWLGDGGCDTYFQCDEFNCDGGDCADDCAGVCGGDSVEDCNGECGGDAVLDDCGVCEGDGSSCSCDDFVLTMNDSYGDGWNGNTWCAGTACATLESGATGTADLCIDMSVQNTVTCDGGSWQSEVSWSLADADGNEVLAGGAPYSGCLGTGCATYGCTDAGSPNYNPDATEDDGSCEPYPGADACYWNESYCGWTFDCGAYYVWPDYDGDGSPDNLGDGVCDSADYNGDGIADGFACDTFACDAGDCSDCSGTCLGDDLGTECWDGSYSCDEADCPEVVDPPAAPADLAVNGGYDLDLGPVLNMTWSDVDGADSYGIYIWDDTPDEICDDGEDNDGDGYTDCADFDCSDLEECQENCSDGIDNDGDGYTDCEDFDCESGTEECPCTGYASYIGDGWCDAANNNEECGYDGGDCCPGDCVDEQYSCEQYGGDCDDCVDPNSADLAEGGECYDDGGPTCADGELLVSMVDAYGDGWNGNILTIGDATFTLESGASGTGCYAGAMDVAVTCDGGSWQSEVSWSISDEATGEVLLDGGAPYSGCLGTCDDGSGDACGDCMAYCVSYVMENYGYSEEDATYWCANTPDSQYGCADSCSDNGGGGDDCDGTVYDANLTDAYGDGWNGNLLCVDDDCVTLESGASGAATFCVADGDHAVTCGGGSWQSEVSWEIVGVASGGCPFDETVTFGGGGDLVGQQNRAAEYGYTFGSLEHKLAEEAKISNSGIVSQYNQLHQSSGNDREGWVHLGDFLYYGADTDGDGYPDYDDFTIYGFTYEETALLGVASKNAAGYSEIVGAEGTTPAMSAPYNLQANDDNGDGTVALTWEYDGFSPVPYPECTGNVSWIGDGWCDSSNNNADCDYDGGDCCESTCDGSDDLYSCDECDADGDGTGCGDQADSDGDGVWDSCCDPAAGGDCAEPEPCESLNPVVTPYSGDPNGCYDFTNAFEFTFEENCGVTGIAYGEDPGDLELLTGGPFYGSFYFFGFGPSETYFFQLSTADGVTSGIFEGTTSDYDCAGDVPEPTACEDAGGVESYIGDGWCDATLNNNEACGYDGGDCCPGDCVDADYSCEQYGGDCSTCVDPDSADLAEGGQCYDDGSGPEAILSFTLETGSEGSTTFTVPEGCTVQDLVVDGGSWQSEVFWFVDDGTCDGCSGGAPWSVTLALAAGEHTFTGQDSYGDGWNGNVATMTCAERDVASSGYKVYKYEPQMLHNNNGLIVTDGIVINKPIIIEPNVDRLVSSFNVYDADGANVGTAFDLLFSTVSDGGCWTVRAYDADLDVESGDSNTACFDGCATAGTGDANGDGELNVLDVVVIVGEVLDPSWDSGSCDFATADANGDGELNVLDVVIIVGSILDGRTVDASSATIYKADNGVTIDANGFVAGLEMKISHDENFVIELTDNAMVADYVTKGNTTHLIVVAPEGEEIFTATGDFTIDEVIAANTNGEYINVDNGMPSEFSLSSAYPNPFNPVTNMKLSLVNAGQVSMNVYNVSGQLVDVLVDGTLDAGYHTVTWDASNVSSGVYFVKVNSGTNVSVQKLMLLK